VELLEPLKLKLTGLEIIAKSDIDAVVIRDTPTVPHTPCSPNILLNLVIGAGAGVVLSTLAALPLMWLLSRRKSAGPSGGGCY
jgi:uncharacterized protein involved in exopolysaccharide biosynthesis